MMHRVFHNRSALNDLYVSNIGLSTIRHRGISSAEIAAALRPFYFVVHPDLFGRYPEQRSVNEESLKHLSAHLEALQNRRPLGSSPRILPFYIRSSESVSRSVRDKFKLVNIHIQRNPDVKNVVKKILESCSLSTEYVDNIKSAPAPTYRSMELRQREFYKAAEETSDQASNSSYGPNFRYHAEREKIAKAQQSRTFKIWINANLSKAHERSDALEGLRNDVKRLEKSITTQLKLKDLLYDCGWNVEHYRGCLKSLERLAEMHQNDMNQLEGRTLVFASSSGVNLEGHVMLFTGDVQHNWLDFIRNIRKQDEYLKRIPAYESALSQVLLGIRIARRKFMPKAQVVNYAAQLCKVTTSMLDYLTNHKFPKSWPESLKDYKIVIESEAGPLMVSPTGQFIAPSTCPGSILIDFLTNHMDEAREKTLKYKKNKYVERELHERCARDLQLKSLTKDDSIDPEKMIACLTRLLTSGVSLRDTILHITHYYSVLSDGTVCIPWNWVME